MPINSDNIKKAMDTFEEEDFVTSKEILQKEIGSRRDEWMQEKLGLTKPLGGIKEEEKPKEEDEKKKKEEKEEE